MYVPIFFYCQDCLQDFCTNERMRPKICVVRLICESCHAKDMSYDVMSVILIT